MSHGLFHSFPRHASGRAEELRVGLTILHSILDFGLLLAPERIQFPKLDVSGEDFESGTTVIQLRACFTLIDERELLHHSGVFGSFAIEFDLDTLHRLGAFPVIYIPQARSGGAEQDFGVLGATLVHQVRDVCVLLQQLIALEDAAASGDDELSLAGPEGPLVVKTSTLRQLLDILRGEKVSFSNLYNYAELIGSFFYHATDVRRSAAGLDAGGLRYYSQREWRLLAGLERAGVALDRPLRRVEREGLIRSVPWFGAEIKLRRDRIAQRAEVCRVISSWNNRPFWCFVKKFHAPDAVREEATELFRRHKVPLNRVAFHPMLSQ